MYHLISSSTNLYWPSTSQYRHILTQYHQVPLIIHNLMSHAQYTWSSSAFSYKADNVLSFDSSFLSEVMIPLLQYIRQVLIRNYKLVSLLPTAHQQTLKEMRWKYPSWHCSMCASLKCPFGIGFHLIEMQTSPTWRCYYIFMRLAPLKCKTCARGPKLRQGPALVVFFFRWTLDKHLQ